MKAAATEQKQKFQTPHEKATAAKKAEKPTSEPKGKSSAKPKPEDGSKGKLGSILGWSVVAAVRAMGKHGWTVDEAQTVLDHLKIPIKPHTLRMAIKRGVDNSKKHRIAKLSAKELNSLK